jgi:S1-C subfamily serine protease
MRLSARSLWRPAPVLSGIALLLVSAGVLAGGAYKWRDAQGNMHFSDQPPADAAASAQGSVEEFALSGEFADVKVSNKQPVPNPTHNGGPSIALEHFDLRLDSANGNNVTIGRRFTGDDCSIGTDVQWSDGVIDLKGKIAEGVVSDRFHNFGYRLLASEEGATGSADLYLDAELASFKLDACDSRKYGRANEIVSGGARSYVRIRWSLRREGVDEALYHGTSEGAFNGWRTGHDAKEVVLKALASATDNLLGDHAFVDVLTGTPAFAQPVREASNVKISVTYGDSGGSFRSRSEQLLRTALTVRTMRGHGSGVLIDAAGYALTNAHVVGTDEEVQVIFGDDVIDARVVRSDRKTDVALLQFEAKGRPAARVSRSEPHPGDPLYVVGTPLNLKLSNTVTQGILSAIREVDGVRLYQTDAAVNPGNSGGPVFNDAGELVAMSVSGLFNKTGSSLNINYLIPVARALAAVGVKDE